MVLVISPLIALMEAQVFDMNRANISACLVGTAQPDPNILAHIRNGEFNIIYSSPEYLQGGYGKKLLDALQNRLILVAIDGKRSLNTCFIQTLTVAYVFFFSFLFMFIWESETKQNGMHDCLLSKMN